MPVTLQGGDEADSVVIGNDHAILADKSGILSQWSLYDCTKGTTAELAHVMSVRARTRPTRYQQPTLVDFAKGKADTIVLGELNWSLRDERGICRCMLASVHELK